MGEVDKDPVAAPDALTLRKAWDRHADDWATWARAPDHDSYWRFHRARFFSLVPPPGRLSVDLGCGEGRVGRDLLALGHRLAAIDASPTLAGLAGRHQLTPLPVATADAAALPFADGCADLVVAFMSLQDVDDLAGAISEAARILVLGGRLCLAIVHPLNSAGSFEGERYDEGAPFVVRGSYLHDFRYADELERNGYTMTFHSAHRPLERYSRALEAAGFVTEAVREVGVDDEGDRWHRVPLFLHLLARRQGR